MRIGFRGSVLLVLTAAVLATAVGCANHPANNTYATAPPYAPPVYPQPQGYAQPAGYAAPVATLPPGAVIAPGTVMQPGAVMQPGTVVGSPVVVDGGGQTPPCPPTYTP